MSQREINVPVTFPPSILQDQQESLIDQLNASRLGKQGYRFENWGTDPMNASIYMLPQMHAIPEGGNLQVIADVAEEMGISLPIQVCPQEGPHEAFYDTAMWSRVRRTNTLRS